MVHWTSSGEPNPLWTIPHLSKTGAGFSFGSDFVMFVFLQELQNWLLRTLIGSSVVELYQYLYTFVNILLSFFYRYSENKKAA